ncbi:DUF502 domain-containing protein [Bdellovibrio svalbardensis]|uniref:DUF502 domain-containing protein n=1 Tax=Bdellovibrio svalbardensis TaxID=2972972 RepID=A0ABT6DLN6_9BACT|nr:DUF502 domain-containing protein [Bdellovibrio svalbardensis]MDG0816048.1 DUF502 domain-containing protein [Bdellovibrio svalbardensis]
MKHLQKIFLQGLVTFLPVALTIYIVYAGISIVDSLLGDALRQVMPVYIPGLGFLLTILIIFLLGFLLNNLIAAGVFHRLEQQLMKVPFIKAIYSPLRDLMNLFSKGGGPGGLQTVVLVDMGETGVRALGLVTRENFKDLPAIDQNAGDRLAVYIPMSYGLGGFTLMVPRSKITPLDMPIEKAMSLAITGWVKAEKNDEV